VLRVQLSYIGTDLNGTKVQTWVPNALSLVQAVGGPVIVSSIHHFLDPDVFGLTVSLSRFR